ncbi:MAG: AI-2E family transporter [Lentisphaeria bacterium]|nr:AI-2E family transporter [Lentisphaeria bacterium]
MERNRILKEKIEDSFSKAKKAISEFADSVQFSSANESEEHVIAALAKTLLAPERILSATDVENFRMVWSRNFSPENVDKIVSFLYDSTLITVAEAAEALSGSSPENRQKIIFNLAELICNSDDPDGAEKYLTKLAQALKIPDNEFKSILEQAKSKGEKRKKLLRSGAGILAALIILLIFILTATWLKSVIFGLILASLMFPIEQYFERKFEKKKGTLYNFFNICGKCESSIKDKIKQKTSKVRPTAAEIKKQESELWIRNSVSMSCIVLIGIILLLTAFFGTLSAGYLNSARKSVKKFLSPPQQTEVASKENNSGAPDTTKPKLAETTVSNVMDNFQTFLEKNRQRFESQPVIRKILDELSNNLNNPDTKQKVLSLIIKKTGGFISFTTGILSAFAVFLLDVLLTIFFFLLFLTKMAQFAKNRRNKKDNYIVRTLFSGNWLPRTTEEDIQETEHIISEIVHKLKVWLRGYLSLMFIDFSVYSIVFYFLNVPYFLIMGAIAGCGILLPFIGPILSCCITCLVTLACGDASAMQILGIVGIYLLHNGVTEQFILYPTVIGESLGLTTLETIIVVLLGGIFAGATGMIFSIPAAAVIKYLVPRIFHYWQPENKQ